MHQAGPQRAAVGRAAERTGPAAQRRAPVQHPLGGRQRASRAQRPDLVPHLVEEALPWVRIGGAERPGLVHDHAGRAEPAGLATQQPGGELEVVVPQEVVGLRQAALPADRGIDQDRDERGRPDRQAAGRRRAALLRPGGERLGPRRVHRVRPAVGPLHPAGQQRRPGSARLAGPLPRVQQGAQRIRLRHRVVVHQPDQVGGIGQGQRQAVGEPAGPAGVLRQRGQPYRRERGTHRAGAAVGGRVVHRDDRVRRPGLRQHRGQ